MLKKKGEGIPSVMFSLPLRTIDRHTRHTAIKITQCTQY